MNYKRIVIIFQIVTHILALLVSVFLWVATSIGAGLGGKGGIYDFISIPDYFVWIAWFIGLGLLSKLIFRKNNLILPITGLMSFVALLIIQIIIIDGNNIHGLNTNVISLCCYTITLLLPISAIMGLVFNK